MLIRDSMVYTAGKLLPGLLGTATTALLTHMLDPAAYGLYGLSLVVMTFGSALGFDWLGLAYLRLAPSAPRAFGTVVWLFAGLSLLTVCGSAATWAAGLLRGIAGPPVAAGLVMTVCYAGFELAARHRVAQAQPGRFFVMSAGRGALSLAGATGAAWLTQDPAWTACGAASGMVGGALLGQGRLTLPPFDRLLAAKVLAFGLPLAASMALASAGSSFVRILLDTLSSAAALGVFTAAFLLVQNTLSVAAAGIASAGYPAAVNALTRGDAEAAGRQITENWSLLLVVLAPMALGMALTAPALAASLVGPHYAAGVASLTPWLATAGFFGAIRAHGFDHLFQLGNRPQALAWVSALAALLTVGVALALIPHYGPVGAAAASLAGAAASCVLSAVWGSRVWPVALPITTAARVAAACGVMALAVSLLPGNAIAKIGMGVASYSSAAVCLNLVGARTRLRTSLAAATARATRALASST